MKPKLNGEKNIYLINLIKFNSKEKVKKIDLEEKMKLKNKFLYSQLGYLSNKSKYSQELERLTKENKNQFKLIKRRTEINIKKEIKSLSNDQRILKGASNKMFLDIIFNNEKFRNYVLSNNNSCRNHLKTDKKEKKITFDSYPKNKYAKMNIDNIQIIPKKNINKIKKSISLYLKNNIENFQMKKNFPKIKTSSLKKVPIKLKNILKIRDINDTYFHHSKEALNNNFIQEEDEIKGMLTINYNNLIRRKNNKRKYIS